MKQNEIKKRYEYAREQAIKMIDDVRMGADPESIYRALEVATLWKLMLGTSGAFKFNYTVMSEMLGATNGGMVREEVSIADRFDKLSRFRIKKGVTPYSGRVFSGAWNGPGRKSVTLYMNSVAGNSPVQADSRVYQAHEVVELVEK